MSKDTMLAPQGSQERVTRRAGPAWGFTTIELLVAVMLFGVVMASGQKARGDDAVDLLIAAAAPSGGLPLCTRNGDHYRMLNELIHVVEV